MKFLTLIAAVGAAAAVSACTNDRPGTSSGMSGMSSSPSTTSPAAVSRATPSGIESTGSAGTTGGAARPAAGTGVVGTTRTQ